MGNNHVIGHTIQMLCKIVWYSDDELITEQILVWYSDAVFKNRAFLQTDLVSIIWITDSGIQIPNEELRKNWKMYREIVILRCSYSKY